MIDVDVPYEIPPLATGRLVHHGIRQRGRLIDLLGIYDGLSPAVKQVSSILLDQRITLPTRPGGPLREGRINLFDGEIALLMPYYRAATHIRARA